MKAKATIELDVLVDDVSSLEDAKAHLRALLGKLKKVAVKAKCTQLELQVDDADFSDLVED